MMTNLILKKYGLKTASRNHICDYCDAVIKKGSLYYKYTSNKIYHKLHAFCFNYLNLESIGYTVKVMQGVNSA